MLFSTATGYALRALAALPEDGTYCLAKDLSSRLGLPGPYLAKILQGLVQADILASVRGPKGGFRLTRPAHRITVGEVESAHTAEVAALITELTAAGAADMGLAMDDEPTVTTRLLAYARAVAHFPTAVKEFQWRNGYFWKLSQAAAAGGKADPCPLHSALLKEVGAV